MNVSFDTKALEADLGRAGKQLTKAMAFTLNDSAKYANADLIKSLEGKVDRPAPFTVRPSGYGVVNAQFKSADMFSEAYVKPAQSAYLKFILEAGGVRGLGDAGASRKNVFVPGQRPDATLGSVYSVKPRRSQFGGVPNAYSQKLFDQTNAPPKGGGGVFWGTIKGKTGFWARPKRTKAIDDKRVTREEKRRHMDLSLRQRGPNGQFMKTGRGSGESGNWLDKRGKYRRERYGDLRVANKGVPILLLQRETQTKHHQIVDNVAVAQAAHERSIGEFRARFERLGSK